MGGVIPVDCWWRRAVYCSILSQSECWKNPKYLHPELHFNVLVVDADLTGMHRSDISLWVIGALFQCLDIFGIFNIFLLLYERKLVHKYIRHTIFSIPIEAFGFTPQDICNR